MLTGLSDKRYTTVALSVITFLAFLVYANTFLASFHLDDTTSIISNPAIRDLLDVRSVWDFLPRRFILYLTLAVNYHFHQLDPLGYHVFNLAVHILAAVMVWQFVLLTLATPVMKGNVISRHARSVALLAGLIFAAHPVQTAAVTYIVQRAASMAALFYVAALCFYVRSSLLQLSGSTTKLITIYYACAWLTAILAMFTKEISITLPLMIVLYEYSFLTTGPKFNWRRVIPFLATLVIIPLTMLVTESPRAQQLRGIVAEAPAGISPAHYLLTQFKVMATYVRLVLFPFNQNLDYDYPVSRTILEWPVLWGMFLLIVIMFAAQRLFMRYRLVAFSIFWFYLTLLPESSLWPIRDVIFEHRLYLPMVGASLCLTAVVFYFLEKRHLKFVIMVLIGLILCYAVLAFRRNFVWKDEFSLWNDVVQKSSQKARPYTNRGVAYFHKGDLTRAIADYTQAIGIEPDLAEAYTYRGVAYGQLKDLNKAIEDHTRAIALDPSLAEAYNNRGLAFAALGNIKQAMADHSKAIALNPRFAEAYYNLGCLFSAQGNGVQAMIEYNKAILMDPVLAEAYNNRGLLYNDQGEFSRAINDYNKAIEIDPHLADPYYNRGLAHDNQGDLTRAIEDYTAAVVINDRFAKPYYRRGVLYYKLREFEKAWADVRQAQKAGMVIAPEFLDALKKSSGRDR